MDYRAVTVAIQDETGSSVLLDSSVVTDPSGRRITSQPAAGGTAGTYTVVDDSWVAGHRNTTCALRFTGYRGGRAIATGAFGIETDCCHVRRESGPAQIVVKSGQTRD